jgi:hypothetical protein
MRKIDIQLTDQELDALGYCVGIGDVDDINDVEEAVHSMITSYRETMDKLDASKKIVKSLEEEHKCLMAEQEAKTKQELDNCKAELNNQFKENKELHHELDVYKAKIEMIELIFGGKVKR